MNKTKVKNVTGGFRVSENFYAGLEARVVDLVENAKRRARANGRTTLMPHDL